MSEDKWLDFSGWFKERPKKIKCPNDACEGECKLSPDAEKLCLKCGHPGRQISSGQGDSTPGGEWHHYPDPWAGSKDLTKTDVHSFVI